MRRITGKETFRRVASAMVVGVVCALLAVPMPAMARKKGNDGPMRGRAGGIAGIRGSRKVIIKVDDVGGGGVASDPGNGSGASQSTDSTDNGVSAEPVRRTLLWAQLAEFYRIVWGR